MKRTNLLILLISIFTIVLLSESCTKEKLCPAINCNSGTLNTESCACECPDGFLGTNCEILDPGQVQTLLDAGKTPLELVDGNIPLDSLYGKMYEGGLIFYLNTTNGTGMVAATEDQSEGAEWGCMGTVIVGAKETALGTGSQNTNEILAACTDDDIASDICDKYSVIVDGIQYDDWFLPSKDELNLMWTNLADFDGDGENTGPEDDPGNLGGFAAFWYWSSSNTDIYYVWLHRFTDGRQYTGDKLSTLRVRAVRSF